MHDPMESGVSRLSNKTNALLLCASLAVTAMLAARLLRWEPSSPMTPAHLDTGRQLAGKPLAPFQATATWRTASATIRTPPFLWSQIEATDYREYIANLRAVGCPEQIIRDIVITDLNQLFGPRRQAILKSRGREYWHKSENQQASPTQTKQLVELGKETVAIFQELLGVRLREQELIDTVYLQLYGSEQELLFLPAEKREAALEALTESDEREMNLAQDGWGKREELFNQKIKLLAKVLSPSELEDFRLRNSPGAATLRENLQYFDCTPEEFRALLAAREGEASHQESGPDRLNRWPPAEVARKVFGDERAKELERVSDMFYINIRRVADERGISLESADQAWQVFHEARMASDDLAKNSSLSAGQRTAQARALREQAESRLTELLGDKAAGAVRSDLRTVLDTSAANIRP
jgi:hypothetical protein